MDPVSGSLILQAASAGFAGISGLSAAKAEKQNADNNAFIGRTRAIQTDTTARQGLSGELASMRSVLSANGEVPSVSTFQIMQTLRNTRQREQRISVGNEMNRVYDFQQKGRNAMSKGRASFLLGALNSGPSLFDLYQYKGGGLKNG